MRCNLAKEVNTCQFCDLENMICNNAEANNQCAFKLSEEEVETNKYIRKERWYEKYYRK